jgi:MFS family permease
VRRLVLDLSPLTSSPAYRRLWSGLSIAQVGQQMATFTVAWQVYVTTGSYFAVGLLGGVALVPLVLGGLYGGSVVDAHDRRTVALVASLGLWVCSLILMVQAWLDLRVLVLLYVVVAAQSACFAVNNPARAAILPRLLPANLLPAANTLTTVSFNLGFTLGPLLGGVAVAVFGVKGSYTIDALTFTAALYGISRLPHIPPLGEVRRAGSSSVLEGLHFLRHRINLLMTFLVDLCAMVFAQPRALFPGLATDVFGGGARTAGYLAAAAGIGALVAAAFSGWLGRVRWQGRMVVAMVVAYGLAIAGFGASRLLLVALVFLALSGAFDMISAVFRSTILQVATPDDLRGRLQGVFVVVVAGGPRVGDVLMGTTSQVLGPRTAVIVGGLTCVAATTWLALRYRSFVRYDARHPHA